MWISVGLFWLLRLLNKQQKQADTMTCYFHSLHAAVIYSGVKLVQVLSWDLSSIRQHTAGVHLNSTLVECFCTAHSSKLLECFYTAHSSTLVRDLYATHSSTPVKEIYLKALARLSPTPTLKWKLSNGWKGSIPTGPKENIKPCERNK